MIFKSKTVNLDITHRCTLQCAKCSRQDPNYVYDKRDTTLEEFDKITDYYQEIIFCGQISDPIFHPQFDEFLKMCKDKKVFAEVHTAASHRKKEQYKKFFEANTDAKWVFGIDGLPKDSHKYRINQDGKYLFDIMLLAKKEYDINVSWQYIVFPYNEDDLFTAMGIARDNDINFLIIESSRFDDEEQLPDLNNKQFEMVYDFKPQCISAEKEHGHTSKGFVLPCCWSDVNKNQIPELTLDHLSLTNADNIDTIITSKEWTDFAERLKNNPPEYCKRYCGYKKKTSIRSEINFNDRKY